MGTFLVSWQTGTRLDSNFRQGTTPMNTLNTARALPLRGTPFVRCCRQCRARTISPRASRPSRNARSPKARLKRRSASSLRCARRPRPGHARRRARAALSRGGAAVARAIEPAARRAAGSSPSTSSAPRRNCRRPWVVHGQGRRRRSEVSDGLHRRQRRADAERPASTTRSSCSSATASRRPSTSGTTSRAWTSRARSW